MSDRSLVTIAHIKTPFKDKFGIPRQSGMVENIISEIEFVPEFRNADSVRGLSDFSHIWVLWEFTGFNSGDWSPTVRPPRLGGNKRMGVFATRSPNRPNSIGMSSLKLIKVDLDAKNGPILKVAGADIVDGTAIYDIKPYITFTDSHPEATFGFAEEHLNHRLYVKIPNEISNTINKETLSIIVELLSLDPRPSYQNDSERIYGMSFYEYNVKFNVNGDILTVTEITKD